ncbi:hypothetical protein ACQ4PT_008496 [Festuca glaucescens]
MGAACDDAVEQLARLLDQGAPMLSPLFCACVSFLKFQSSFMDFASVDLRSFSPRSRISLSSLVEEPLKKTFQNVHQGYPTETLVRFLKAREWHVTNAHKMGIPVFAFGVGQSTYDKASILTAISAVDDLNYPEKAESYYIVNAPYIFSACWKVVKPLLQERQERRFMFCMVLIMDHFSIPHFCRREGSSKSSLSGVNDCFSLDHPFYQELYRYIEQQALTQELVKQCSLHVDIPDQDPEDVKIVEAIEAEFHKLGEQNGSANVDNKITVSV